MGHVRAAWRKNPIRFGRAHAGLLGCFPSRNRGAGSVPISDRPAAEGALGRRDSLLSPGCMTIPLLSFSRVAAHDIASLRLGQRDADVHLSAAVSWLCRAHDVGTDDGVSYGYSLRGGWRPSYIETTGYIARTFFDLAAVAGHGAYRDRAIRMVRWLCTVQNADGSFFNPRYGVGRGIVFDAGQDLLGLVRAHRETGDESLLDAARRSGDWLVEVADDDGRWRRSTHLGIPHVYNTRVAWALLELNAIDRRLEYEQVARANLDWALSQQYEGWFDHVAFERGVAPFTNTIAYAIRGLWEASRLMPNAAWERAATRGADVVLSRLRHDGFLPGQIDGHGRTIARYCCLTGSAQMAIVWAKLCTAATEGLRYRDGAVRAVRYVMRTQDVDSRETGIRGGIKGSHPIWGRYSPMAYPNWATKFFVDALLATKEWL